MALLCTESLLQDLLDLRKAVTIHKKNILNLARLVSPICLNDRKRVGGRVTTSARHALHREGNQIA